MSGVCTFFCLEPDWIVSILEKDIEIDFSIVVFLPLFCLITIIFQYLFLLHLLKSINHIGTSIIDCYKITTFFNLFWKSWREERNSFQSLSQWWDIGKVHIKICCLQYTAQSIRSLNKKNEDS